MYLERYYLARTYLARMYLSRNYLARMCLEMTFDPISRTTSACRWASALSATACLLLLPLGQAPCHRGKPFRPPDVLRGQFAGRHCASFAAILPAVTIFHAATCSSTL